MVQVTGVTRWAFGLMVAIAGGLLGLFRRLRWL
jgi:hypothetical protein